MLRFNCFSAVAAFVLAPTGQALAQPQSPRVPLQNQPTFSPYLNLTRRDASPAINYYGLVRPQIATRNNLQALQQQLAMDGQQQQLVGQPVVNPDLPITGQQTFFLNTGGYFQNNRSGFAPTYINYTTGRSPPTPTRPATFPGRVR